MNNLSVAKKFLLSSAFFFLAVFVSSFLSEVFLSWSIRFFIVFLLLLFLYLLSRKKKLILLFLAFFVLGIWRYSVSLPIINSGHISYYNGQEKVLNLKIIKHPERYDRKISFVAEDQILVGRLLIYLRGDYDLSYGDKINLKCKLVEPERIDDFAYDRYLALSSLYTVCYYPEVLNIKKGEFALKNIIYNSKIKFSNLIKKNLSSDKQLIARAILLGEKKEISDETREIYSKSGLSHIIAISGMHIGILLLIISSSLYFLGVKRINVFLISSLLIFLYLLLLDFPASATRASVMGVFILLAFLVGRLNKIIYSLNFIAFTLVFLNPKVLRDDLGFVFSFLAVLGIVIFYQDLNNLVKTKNWFLEKSWQLVSISISAQIFIVPLISYKFEIISIVSPLSNLLVLWTLPFLLSFLLIALSLSFIPVISTSFFYLSEILLNYITLIVDIIVKFQFSFISFKFSIHLLIFYYILLLLLILYKKRGSF